MTARLKQDSIIILCSGLNGLGAIRSAHKAGLSIVVIFTSKNDLGNLSRLPMCRYFFDPNQAANELLSLLVKLHASYGAASIIACSDKFAELLSQIQTKIKRYHYVIAPSAITVSVLNDKKKECRAVADRGVLIPHTYYELDTELQCYPVLIKPRTYEDYACLGAKNLLINSRSSFDQFKANFEKVLDRFIGQEVIEGEDSQLWVCNVTFDLNHELVAFFSFSRLGTMPSHFGVTSSAVSIYNEALLIACKEIGKAFSFVGPAMIEFKRNPLDGQFYYIETNPRLGMCNWFDTNCGVNNVLATHLVAKGECVALSQQRDGVHYINWLGDFIARLEDREGFLSILSQYFKFLKKRKVSATFEWNDPMPAIFYWFDTVKSLAPRVVRRIFRIRRDNSD